MIQNILLRGFLIVFFIFNFHISKAQIPSGGEGKKSDKDFSFMPIPYINYDRTLGLSGGFLPMAMYNLSKKDTISPSSVSGGFGMYTTNKSWFLLQFNKLYFNEDKYRAVMAAGVGSFNSQFYSDLPFVQDFIGYNAAINFFKIELQRQIIPKFYIGLNYSYAEMYTELEISEEVSEQVYLNGLGGILSYDGRDNVYYPYRGSIANIKYSSFPKFMGNDFESNKIVVDFNKYFKMKNERDIIALRAYTGIGIGELSFNQQFTIGNNDIRGYTQGKYRGEQVIAIQGEYRWNPFEKIGFVGFAGVATIFSGMNEKDNGKLLPGIGTGFRYNVFPKNHMNVGMDFAAGIDDWGIYFKIGEAF